jgi:hypothetical protein
MPQETEATQTGGDRLQAVLLRPPVSIDDLRADTENDPEGAEEFATLIRALRKENSPYPRF